MPKFTNEKEINGSLRFLNALISRNKFTTTVYHKHTVSGVYSKSNTFIADA